MHLYAYMDIFQVTADLTPVNPRKVAVKFDYFKIGGLVIFPIIMMYNVVLVFYWIFAEKQWNRGADSFD